MKKSTLFLIFMGLFLLLGCTNTDENQNRNPREDLNFFYNVQEEGQQEKTPNRARVYYHGEHYFRE